MGNIRRNANNKKYMRGDVKVLFYSESEIKEYRNAKVASQETGIRLPTIYCGLRRGSRIKGKDGIRYLVQYVTKDGMGISHCRICKKTYIKESRWNMHCPSCQEEIDNEVKIYKVHID